MMKRIVWLGSMLVFLLSCLPFTSYEYRYRVFYGIEISPKEKATPKREAEIFYPLGSLNRAMDQFAQEGFQLYAYQRIKGGQNYIFKFRRPLKRVSENDQYARLCGIYRLMDEKKKETLLAILPAGDKNYRVVELEGTGDSYNAAWSETGLMYHTPKGLARLVFSKDGKEINCTIESTKGKTKQLLRLKGKRE